ncbi:MAG: NAD(P)/FAD-dependent oxidoreductase [Lachnospiraceae bacterium]|nr:NAD(P)/FAD-dependent oxidoreductase [Lachnospiraceae bacterium]
MLRINQLRLPVSHSQEDLVRKAKKILGCEQISEIRIVRRSVDARKKPELYFNYILDIAVKNQQSVFRRCDKRLVSILQEVRYQFPIKNYGGLERPVVIGAGPAGMFCALMLARAGFKPILLERGKRVEERIQDVNQFWNSGSLNPDSNVQFGEGGAGTFSDGKLNTLVKDKYGRGREVLKLFVDAGAPEEILYDHKPHIGTDILQKVVVNLRHAIERAGGTIRFQTKVTDVIIRDNKITGVMINGEELLEASYIVLAPGHSARDTLKMLYERKLVLEAKPFAVGMRVEHPQELINLSQYGSPQNSILGSAPYKLTAQTLAGRGVYSFCMCPGGFVVNASSEEGHLAVNGMSYSKRDGRNANSAIIVSVTPEDYGCFNPLADPLAGIEFQRRLEKEAYRLAEGKIPVERYGDYKSAVCSEASTAGTPPDYADTVKMPEISEDFSPSIKGEWKYAPVHEILPKELSQAFVEGMEQFGRMIKGFNHTKVLVEGIESRTSSPVRIVRDEKLQSSVRGLYPCGEGAGYAGGIMSAAMDGIRIAEAVAEQIVANEG